MKKLANATLGIFGYELSKRHSRGGSFPTDPFKVQHQLLSRLNKSHLCIFDIGANLGQTARKYRFHFPAAEIYCFEPFQDSLAELRNQFSDDGKLHVVPKAVAQESGTATFYVNELHATNSLLPRPSSDRRYYPKSAGPRDTVEVETTGLDEFVRERGLSVIDILKFDIQGGELDALRGAEAILTARSTSLIYTEIMFTPHYERGPLFHEIWALLADFGYSLFDVYDLHRARNGQLRYGDGLFVSESMRRDVIDKYAEEP